MKKVLSMAVFITATVTITAYAATPIEECIKPVTRMAMPTRVKIPLSVMITPPIVTSTHVIPPVLITSPTSATSPILLTTPTSTTTHIELPKAKKRLSRLFHHVTP